MFAADERLDQATRKIVESDLAIEQRLAKALVSWRTADLAHMTRSASS
jgi:hypothetical protein